MRIPRFGKLGAFVVAGMLAMVVSVPAATAAQSGALDTLVSGPFTGTTGWQFTAAGCSFVHQTFDGTYGTRHKPSGSFHLDGCVTPDLAPPNSGLFDYVGTFSVKTRGHTAVTGTVSGTEDASMVPCAPLNFVLTVTHGTGRLSGSTGTITLTGNWCGRVSPDIEPVADPINGELVASLG